MIGNDIRKENFVTSSFLFPHKSPALIVVPDLDTPGKTAKPCATPMRKASLKEKVFCSFFLETLSLVKSKIAEMKKHKGKSPPENDIFITGISIKHKIHVGIVATAILKVSKENGWRIICQISLRYTTKIEHKVATCKIMLTKRLSSMPNNFENSTRCPEEETGKNSVSPWTSPKKNKARISTKASLLYLYLG